MNTITALFYAVCTDIYIVNFIVCVVDVYTCLLDAALYSLRFQLKIIKLTGNRIGAVHLFQLSFLCSMIDHHYEM